MNILSFAFAYLKVKNPKNQKRYFTRKLVVLAVALSLPINFTGVVFADSYDERMNNLRNKNSTLNTLKRNLVTEQEGLAGRIASLQASISELQTQITAKQARSEELKISIAKSEAEIVQQRSVLGANLKQMYLESDVTTFETLVISKDLSEFANKEQYRLSVEDKVKQTLDKIKELKAQQENEKKQVETILAEQQTRHAQLAADQAEISRLLSLNQDQQSAYSSQINANNSQIASLRSQQAAENARHFRGIQVGGTGGYPWANVPFPNSIADPWGMYKRQCVSYTAWKVASSGRHMPYWGGRGNANQWDNNARAAGIPVDGSPRAGDVAVSNAGTYGHVLYVERVNGDGSIFVSQYNAGWDGRYSVGTRSTSGLVFIHF